jgi:hypothetical protein
VRGVISLSECTIHQQHMQATATHVQQGTCGMPSPWCRARCIKQHAAADACPVFPPVHSPPRDIDLRGKVAVVTGEHAMHHARRSFFKKFSKSFQNVSVSVDMACRNAGTAWLGKRCRSWQLGLNKGYTTSPGAAVLSCEAPAVLQHAMLSKPPPLLCCCCCCCCCCVFRWQQWCCQGGDQGPHIKGSNSLRRMQVSTNTVYADLQNSSNH